MPAVPAPLPENEAERLARLREYEVLDTDPELAFDDIVAVAAEICEVPVAFVSLVDADRQWFKAKVGLDGQETPRELAFCAHAILDDALLEVADTHHDPRFSGNPFVTEEPNIRFYAGAPLDVGDDLRVGTLCVVDKQPRELDETQRRALRALARQVVAQLELRRLLTAERRVRAERERLLREMEEVSGFKSRLLATVSHEMRTPLTAIRGALQLVCGGVLGEIPLDVRNTLGIASRSTERLIRLTNDLLDLEQLGGVTPLRPTEVDLVQAIDAAAAQVRGLRADVTIRVEVADDAPRVARADGDRVEQLLVNLLGNAVRFSPSGSEVVLALLAAPEGARFEIRDHGPGLSLEDQTLIFQPFVQCGTQAQRAGGSGLGLSICRSIGVLHGGRVGCESALGEGATFFFELPISA